MGEDIVIFSVGLDAARANPTLLRYMANIGDDGSRANDPCDRPWGNDQLR